MTKNATSADTTHEHAETNESELIEAVLDATPAPPERIEGIVVAQLAGHTSEGEPLIDFDGNSAGAPIAARSVVPLSDEEPGRELAVAFEHGDVRRPIVMGLMAALSPRRVTLVADEQSVETAIDDEEIVLSVNKRVVVRCGKASVTLTPAGKIILRGEYVLSRSKGVNRILGGSVQIN